jgi:hypothetical protein
MDDIKPWVEEKGAGIHSTLDMGVSLFNFCPRYARVLFSVALSFAFTVRSGPRHPYGIFIDVSSFLEIPEKFETSTWLKRWLATQDLPWLQLLLTKPKINISKPTAVLFLPNQVSSALGTKGLSRCAVSRETYPAYTVPSRATALANAFLGSS